jgi:hypothetical protein
MEPSGVSVEVTKSCQPIKIIVSHALMTRTHDEQELLCQDVCAYASEFSADMRSPL